MQYLLVMECLGTKKLLVACDGLLSVKFSARCRAESAQRPQHPKLPDWSQGRRQPWAPNDTSILVWRLNAGNCSTVAKLSLAGILGESVFLWALQGCDLLIPAASDRSLPVDRCEIELKARLHVVAVSQLSPSIVLEGVCAETLHMVKLQPWTPLFACALQRLCYRSGQTRPSLPTSLL